MRLGITNTHYLSSSTFRGAQVVNSRANLGLLNKRRECFTILREKSNLVVRSAIEDQQHQNTNDSAQPASNKRRTAWNKGVPTSEEVRKKNSESMKQRWQDPEFRAGVTSSMKGKSPWNKGRTLSDETREKMRLSKLNHQVSKATRQKMSAARRGRPLAPEAAALVSAKLAGQPKSEEHKRNIASTQRRRHAAIRVLNAVESVYEASIDGNNNNSSSTNSSSGMSMSASSAGIPRMSFDSKKKAKSNILNAFKSELREYRALQDELSPWTNAFKERHGKKPSMADVHRTGIEWLISRYKHYIVLRDRLFNESPLLRGRLNGGVMYDEDGYMSDGGGGHGHGHGVHGGSSSGHMNSNAAGRTNANGPAAKSVMASRIAMAMQYKMALSKNNNTTSPLPTRIASTASASSSMEKKNGEEDAIHVENRMREQPGNDDNTLKNIKNTKTLKNIESDMGALSIAEELINNDPQNKKLVAIQGQTKAPPRVRAAMHAAMEYRNKKALATKAAANAAAVAAKARVPSTSVSSSSNSSSSSGNTNTNTSNRNNNSPLYIKKTVDTKSIDSSIDALVALESTPSDVLNAQTLAHKAFNDVKEAEVAVQRALDFESLSNEVDDDVEGDEITVGVAATIAA